LEKALGPAAVEVSAEGPQIERTGESEESGEAALRGAVEEAVVLAAAAR